MKKISAFLLAIFPLFGIAQGTVDDYNNAFSIKEKFGYNKILNAVNSVVWINDNMCWFSTSNLNGKEFYVVDADKKSKSTLFNNSVFASQLSKISGVKVDEKRIDISNINFNESCTLMNFNFKEISYAYDLKKHTIKQIGKVEKTPEQTFWTEVDDEKNYPPSVSPDGKYSAFIKNYNVCIKEISSSKESQLSIDGTLSNYYSSNIIWSPDSKYVMSCKIRPVEKRYIYYVESSPSDQLQPKLHKQEYAKPGDELAFKIPGIFSVDNKKIIASTDLINNQYELSNFSWTDDSQAVRFDYNGRGHKIFRVIEFGINGSMRSLIEEKSDKYVNYTRLFRYDLQKENRIIRTSEQDNYNQLYMLDTRTGKDEYQITKGEFYVRDIVYVDEKNRKIIFSANGVDKDIDPYLIKYYSVDFTGKNFKCLTPENFMHTGFFSNDYKYFVDIYSSVSDPGKAVLRTDDDGKIIMELSAPDISLLKKEGWTAPEVFVAKGRDNKTDMWGLIYRPQNFDPTKKYPVIEYIYQGPGDQYVEKKFRPYDWAMSDMAQLGFICVMVDGMGTSFRSREFENICYKNLKDAGLPDHIAWIKHMAEKYPYIDINNVGIFGCSAGGQESTTAVLTHGDFYKCAYSACGCHDNRMDKIWWNELWMGYPVDESYTECSNVEMAKNLNCPLMLVVGELDDNVDPASTMQVAAALIKANKNFELVVIPGAHHTMGEAFGDHKRFDFFVKNLLKKDSPEWNNFNFK